MAEEMTPRQEIDELAAELTKIAEFISTAYFKPDDLSKLLQLVDVTSSRTQEFLEKLKVFHGQLVEKLKEK